MIEINWFEISDVDQIDTPALVVYSENIDYNINNMLTRVGDANKLRPHIKTYKMAEVVERLMARGIFKFKCATIAEAELLGMVGAKDALLAYQPIGPKINRLLEVQQKYSNTHYSTLIDNKESAKAIADVCEKKGTQLDVFIDLNVGMNRTGILPNDLGVELYSFCQNLQGIVVQGLHIYDGHLRDPDIVQRKKDCDDAFEPVKTMASKIEAQFNTKLEIVVGGTPSFSVHADREGVNVSPGTSVLWDFGYKSILPEQDYKFGALVITRVISQLPNNQLCLDLGHKSIAAENPFPRVQFLNLPGAKEIGQSEEHLVVQVDNALDYPVGTVLYGVPKHVCPTVALYERAFVIENHKKIDEWRVLARDRKITI